MQQFAKPSSTPVAVLASPHELRHTMLTYSHTFVASHHQSARHNDTRAADATARLHVAPMVVVAERQAAVAQAVASLCSLPGRLQAPPHTCWYGSTPQRHKQHAHSLYFARAEPAAPPTGPSIARAETVIATKGRRRHRAGATSSVAAAAACSTRLHQHTRWTTVQ